MSATIIKQQTKHNNNYYNLFWVFNSSHTVLLFAIYETVFVFVCVAACTRMYPTTKHT